MSSAGRYRVAVHESAHAVVAERVGFKVVWVKFFPPGHPGPAAGVTRYDLGARAFEPDGTLVRDEMLVDLAGVVALRMMRPNDEDESDGGDDDRRHFDRALRRLAGGDCDAFLEIGAECIAHLTTLFTPCSPVREQVEHLAGHLFHRGELSGWDVRQILAGRAA